MSKILQTPGINSISTFDPSYETNIFFSYSDNQAVKNRAVITDNRTGSVVYDSTQDGMRLYHTIPADTLLPDKQYLMQIQVFDADGNSSNLSDAALFYCFSTPTFAFHEISDGSEYKNASIELSIDYSQAENEELKGVQFFEYAYDKTLLKSSRVIYSSAPSCSFYSLQNNSTYYFRAVGETNHGMKLDTGYIEVYVSFFTIKANVIFQVNNDYKCGYIELLSNIKDISYELENENYKFHNGSVTLTNNSVTYSDFTVDGDFSLFVEAKELPVSKFFETDNGNISLEIINVCDVYYCRLNIKGSNLMQCVPLPKARLTTGNEYITTDDSKLIEIVDTSYDDNDFVVFEVKRQNGYYSLKAYYKAEIVS